MKTGFCRTTTSVLGLMSAAMGVQGTAMAQAVGVAADQSTTPSPSEIVVTAQRRAEKLLDVPISVSTLNSNQLSVANVNQLSDTAKLTPGLRFDAVGPAVQPSIRGVGTAITTAGGGPNVGIYVDGFFQSNAYVSDFQLLRVENIQVLKGPQGTLFGRNTTGGAILVTSSDPSTTPSGQFKASYGRYNSLTLQGYVTGGITENIALDVEGLFRRGDGFQTDVTDGNDEIGKYRAWSIRTGLKIDLSPDVSVLLRYIHSEADDPTNTLTSAYVDTTGQSAFFSKVSPAGQAVYGRSSSAGLALVPLYAPTASYSTRPGAIALNPPVGSKPESDIFQGTIKADLGFANLTSYTQYRRDSSPYYLDLDATAVPIFNLFVGVPNRTFSQELLLSSKAGARLQWTAGLNYFQNRDTYDVNAGFGGAPIGPFGGSTANTKSYAAFVDATYAVSNKFFVTLGGRYSHDIVTDASFTTNFTTTSYVGPNGETVPFAGGPGVAIPVADLKNNSFTPRVVLRYKPGDASSIYASFTRGYKAGILNVGGNSQEPVQPEKINAYEVGYKFDNRVFSFSAAGFYYDYKNLQVSSFQTGAAQIRNAATSEIYGLEGQAAFKVSQAFNINAGLAWTHARYKSFTNAPYYTYCDPAAAPGTVLVCPGGVPGGLTQTLTDASGFHMLRAPEITGNIGASYTLDLVKGKLNLGGNLYYTSSFYFDPAEQFKQPGYAILSLRAEWTDPSSRFTVAVFGDNVTNKRFQTQVSFNTLGIGSVWNSPTTYGVSVGAKF